MKINPITIVVVIGVVFIIYLVIMSRISKNINSKKAKNSQQVLKNDMTKLEQKGVLYGAFLAQYRMEDDVTTLEPKINFIEYEGGLKQQWSVCDHESAIRRLDKLAHLIVTQKYDAQLSKDEHLYNKLLRKVGKKVTLPKHAEETAYSTYAWDICRLSALAKWCFWLGYISRKEMDHYFKVCSTIVKQQNDTWKEYAVSFLLGRTLAGFDLDDIYIEVNQILKQFNKRKISLK